MCGSKLISQFFDAFYPKSIRFFSEVIAKNIMQPNRIDECGLLNVQ